MFGLFFVLFTNLNCDGLVHLMLEHFCYLNTAKNTVHSCIMSLLLNTSFHYPTSQVPFNAAYILNSFPQLLSNRQVVLFSYLPNILRQPCHHGDHKLCVTLETGPGTTRTALVTSAQCPKPAELTVRAHCTATSPAVSGSLREQTGGREGERREERGEDRWGEVGR